MDPNIHRGGVKCTLIELKHCDLTQVRVKNYNLSTSLPLEPGYYRENEFGIRIEDVAVIVPANTKVDKLFGWIFYRPNQIIVTNYLTSMTLLKDRIMVNERTDAMYLSFLPVW